MDLKLNAEEMAAIASAAIFEQMSAESRATVIQAAIIHLVTPDSGSIHSMNRGKTPLQVAFESALQQAAYAAVREKVANDPEVNTYIHQLLGPLIGNALKAESEVYKTSLSEHIGTALGQWLNEKARGE